MISIACFCYRVPISSVLSLFLVYVWINILSPIEEPYTKQYKYGCFAIALSCIIEQMTQSVILVAQSYCFVKLKVIFETIYIVSRTIIFVCFVSKYPGEAIHAFSIAQISSVVILCLLYYGFFYWYIKKLNYSKPKDMTDFRFTSVKDFFPGVMSNQDTVLNKDLCLLTVSFAKQSVIKQILTEGERYVMTISPVLSFSQQSVYDIVNNLGSLAARFIFRPIEESAYFYFTQMIRRDVPLSKQNQVSLVRVATLFSFLSKMTVGFN